MKLQQHYRMVLCLAMLILLGTWCSLSASADVIASWDFTDGDTFPDEGNASITSIEGCSSEVRTDGDPRWHVNSANDKIVWQITLSTLHFEDIQITWDMRGLVDDGNSTGLNLPYLYYEFEGIERQAFAFGYREDSFATFGPYLLARFTNDDPALDPGGREQIIITYEATNDTTYVDSASHEFDNILIEGTHTPEPASLCLLLTGGALLLKRHRPHGCA